MPVTKKSDAERPPEEPDTLHPGGMPKFEPTPEQRSIVQSMAGYGIPHEDIALVVINPRTGLPIDPKTLRLHFRVELDTGAVSANSKVVESLYTNATKNGNVTAQIWWTKARMRWREGIEHSGVDGEAIEVRDVTNRDRAKALLAVVAKAKAERT